MTGWLKLDTGHALNTPAAAPHRFPAHPGVHSVALPRKVRQIDAAYMPQEPQLRDVGDTALWMADVRAREYRRRDAAIHDPLAALLAGDRGPKIARIIPGAAYTEWGVLMRTAAIDRLLLSALVEGADTVVDLGAGLDTRPYRLEVPQDLRWFEIDLPHVIAMKNATLSGNRPCCSVTRVALDLTDRAERQRLLTKICESSARTVVISEGALPYLSEREVSELAADLARIKAICSWILDFDNAGVRPAMPKAWNRVFQAAPIRFQVSDWFAFFRACGWEAQAVITSAQQAELLGRSYPRVSMQGWLMRSLPKSWQLQILSTTGVAAMRKAPKGA
jgi:methyltransferase (TIGR00027 family)